MLRFSKEQMDRLKPYENHLHSAYYSQTLVGCGRMATDAILAMWNEVTGQNRTICNGCAGDVFSLLKDVGKIYYDTIQNPEPEKKPTRKRTAKK